MIPTATGPGSLYLTGEEELTYEWYWEAVYSRRGTVGQCMRDSNRAIARHCETVRYSPRPGRPGEYAPYQAWLLHRPEKVT